MTAIPGLNALRNAANQGVLQQGLEDVTQVLREIPGGSAETTLTIAAGLVTPTLGEHAIDTEAAASLDDLDWIAQTNRPDGSLLLVRAANAAHVVRLRHNIAGNGELVLKGGINCRLETTDAWVLLKRTGLTWEEVFRSLGGWRERLTANRTYYVRTDGNDANEGRENTAGGAFLTMGRAWGVIRDTLDLAGFVVTVQLADGTYTAANTMSGIITGAAGPSGVVFKGNTATPANVIINTTSAACITAVEGAQFHVVDMELRTTTSGDCIVAFHLGTKVHVGNVRFGACAGIHLNASYAGAIESIGNYSITGGAVRHWNAHALGAIFIVSRTITLTGTPAFSGQFAAGLDGANLKVNANTFSGTATGTRYSVTVNSVLQAGGAGATYLPGNAAGSTATGGQYV